MAIDAQLLEILVCPEDKGTLWYFEAENFLYNPRLKRRYRVTDDIPVMLASEAESVDDAAAKELDAKVAAGSARATFQS